MNRGAGDTGVCTQAAMRCRSAAAVRPRSGKAVAALSLLVVLLSLVPSVPSAQPPARITVAHSASWTPFAYLSRDGEPEGMLIELWRLFGKKTGTEIEFRLVDWHESLELVRSGQADVHGGLTVSDKRDAYLDFSGELFRVRTLLFVPVDSDRTDLAAMEDETVGVVDSTFEQDFIHTHYPSVRVIAYPNSEAMAEAAVRGEVHAFVADYPAGYYRLLLVDAMDRYRATSTMYSESIHAGVKEGAPELVAFINAGMSRITAREKRSIAEKWLIPSPASPAWLWPAVFSTVGLLLVAALASHYWSLRRAVQARTQELEQKIHEIAAAKAHAERLASTDTLTGVANRRAFYDKAATEMRRASRYRRPLCIALFDLDHFKQINDSHGHEAGDRTLRAFVDRVTPQLRSEDFFARLGGDEFVVLLAETPREEAVSLVQRIATELQENPVKVGGALIRMSCSVGITQFDDENSVDAWLTRADALLYRGKSQGRGQVVAT